VPTHGENQRERTARRLVKANLADCLDQQDRTGLGDDLPTVVPDATTGLVAHHGMSHTRVAAVAWKAV